MKRILIISLYFIVILGIIFLMGFSSKIHKERVCKKVNIEIEYGKREFASDVMLLPSDIKHNISLNFETIEGKNTEDIDIESIENILAEINFVKDIDVYQEMDGKINIHITQRRPIMRVYGATGKNFYIDENGMAMPIKQGYPARVIIVSGQVEDRCFNDKALDLMDSKNDSLPGVKTLRNLFLMCKFIDNDNFLRKDITQIEISPKNQIIMTPLIGNHVIEMRTFNDFEKKLNNLKIFYKHAMNKGGWESYSKINIEFNNQIVCTKN